VALSKDQLDSIKHDDERAKKEFLTKEPEGLDNTLRNIEPVKRIYDKWGK